MKPRAFQALSSIRSLRTSLLIRCCLLGGAATMLPAGLSAADATWDGGASTVFLNDAANWTGDVLPNGSGDTATWNGTAPGNLELIWSGGFGSAPSGTQFALAATQTSGVRLASNALNAGNAGINLLAIGNITLASGAGAFTLGDGEDLDNTVFRNPGGTAANTLTNNSAHPATFASNVRFNSGGGSGRTVTFTGSGDWQVNSRYTPSGSGVFNTVKDGAGTLGFGGEGNSGTFGGTLTVHNGSVRVTGNGHLGNNTFGGAITLNHPGRLEYQSTNQQTISGVISGNGPISQNAGTLTLTGNNTHTGTVTLNGGTLVLGGVGNINSSASLTINGTGAVYRHNSSTASTQSITLTQGTVAGTGTLHSVTVGNGSGGIVSHGNNNTAALTLGTLAFQGAAALQISDEGNPATAPIVVSGTLSTTPANGSIVLNASNAFWNSGTTYAMVQAGTLQAAASHFSLGTISGLTSRQSASIVTNGNTLGLQILGDTPRWTGADSSEWRVGSTGPNANWQLITNGTKTDYLDGDACLFDDLAANTTVNLTTAHVSPAVVNFNNSTKNYSLNGSFGIAAGALNKHGTGTLTLATTNSHTAGTTLTAGTLQIAGAGTLGAANVPLQVSGGTLDLGGSTQTVGSLTLGGASTITGGTLVAGQLVSTTPSGIANIQATLDLGGGALSHTGAGNLVLGAALTHTGPVTVGGGMLTLQGPASLAGSSSITLSGGSLDLNGAITTTGPITISGAAASGETFRNGSITPTSLTFNATSGNAIVTTNFDGPCNVLVNGAGGILTLAGDNAHTGTTTLQGGTLRYTGGYSGFGNHLLTGPTTLEIASNGTVEINAIQVNSFGTSVNIQSGLARVNTITTSGHSHFRFLRLLGGVLDIAQDVFAPDLATRVVLDGGTLKADNPAGIRVFSTMDNLNLANRAVEVLAGGGTFDTAFGNVTLGDDLQMGTLNGTLNGRVRVTGDGSLTGGILNNGPLELDGTSAWDMAGFVSRVGGLEGTGRVEDSQGAGSFTIQFDNNIGPFTFPGTLAGADSFNLVKAGSGTQVLAGSNLFEGEITLQGGALGFASAAALANCQALHFTGGAFQFSEGFTADISALINAGYSTGAVALDTNGQSVTLAGNLDGFLLGGLTKQGGGTLSLTGTNSYQGTTTISGGILSIGSADSLPGNLVVLPFGTGTLQLHGDITLPHAIQISGMANEPQSVTGRIESSGDNTIQGDVTFADVGGLTTTILSHTGTLTLLGNLTTTMTLGPRSFHFAGSGDVILGGIITDRTDETPVVVGLSKGGTGMLTLANGNTYSGDTVVSGGFLMVQGNSIPDSGRLILQGGKVELAGTEVVDSLHFGEIMQAAGTWGASGSGAQFIDDSRFEGTGILQVTQGGAPPQGYAAWATLHAGGQAPELDFDNDGVANGVEFFMGITTPGFTANPAPVAGTVSWPKDPAFAGTYRVESSTNLASWTDVTAAAVEEGGFLRYTLPAGPVRQFVRLSVQAQ